MHKFFVLLSVVCIAAGCPLKKNEQATGPVNPCEYLIESQKEFAALLSATHQQVFCSQFTNEQRSKVISLSDTGLTPDEAVEQVLTESRGTTPETDPKKKSHKPLSIIK